MGFFSKIGKGIGKLAKSVGKIGKGVFNVGKKVVGTALSVVTPIAATAAGALLPGPLGQGLAGAVSGVGMGLQNILTPEQKEKISILYSNEGVEAVQNANVENGVLVADVRSNAIAPSVVEGVNTGAAIVASAQTGQVVNGVSAGNAGIGALLQKYFWVPVVGVLAFVLLKRR